MPRLHSVPYMASHAYRASSTQIYIGFALALFEDVPMGIIGLHFLAVKYQIPLFQAISVVVSWLLLGMKISGIKTLHGHFCPLRPGHGPCSFGIRVVDSVVGFAVISGRDHGDS